MRPLAQFFQDPQGNWDEQAALSCIGFLTLCGLEIFSVVVRRQPFNAESFGIAIGSVMGATLVGMGYRTKGGGQNGVSDRSGG